MTAVVALGEPQQVFTPDLDVLRAIDAVRQPPRVLFLAMRTKDAVYVARPFQFDREQPFPVIVLDHEWRGLVEIQRPDLEEWKWKP